MRGSVPAGDAVELVHVASCFAYEGEAKLERDRFVSVDVHQLAPTAF
jgi:hypothetical protein